ncbi:MAG: hypothetical protein ABR958_01675 [Dehalococcoidales bacterium]
MAEQTRLASLLEKQQKLEADIESEKAKVEAAKVLNKIGADVATVVQQAAVKAKVDVKVLHGKFFALTVDDGGKLSVEVVTKANGKSNGNGKANGGTTTNGGEFEYFLKDGRGPFETIQKAMEALAVPEANRPKHNRYDRLSKDWKAKIEQKAKATEPKATEPAKS